MAKKKSVQVRPLQEDLLYLNASSANSTQQRKREDILKDENRRKEE